MTKMIQMALTHPDRSWLRKMSLKTMISNQIQMKNMKNQSMDQKTSPVPHSAANNLIATPPQTELRRPSSPKWGGSCGDGPRAARLARPDGAAGSPAAVSTFPLTQAGLRTQRDGSPG
jgi:hypothetical protein